MTLQPQKMSHSKHSKHFTHSKPKLPRRIKDSPQLREPFESLFYVERKQFYDFYNYVDYFPINKLFDNDINNVEVENRSSQQHPNNVLTMMEFFVNLDVGMWIEYRAFDCDYYTPYFIYNIQFKDKLSYDSAVDVLTKIELVSKNGELYTINAHSRPDGKGLGIGIKMSKHRNKKAIHDAKYLNCGDCEYYGNFNSSVINTDTVDNIKLFLCSYRWCLFDDEYNPRLLPIGTMTEAGANTNANTNINTNYNVFAFDDKSIAVDDAKGKRQEKEKGQETAKEDSIAKRRCLFNCNIYASQIWNLVDTYNVDLYSNSRKVKTGDEIKKMKRLRVENKYNKDLGYMCSIVNHFGIFPILTQSETNLRKIPFVNYIQSIINLRHQEKNANNMHMVNVTLPNLWVLAKIVEKNIELNQAKIELTLNNNHIDCLVYNWTKNQWHLPLEKNCPNWITFYNTITPSDINNSMKNYKATLCCRYQDLMTNLNVNKMAKIKQGKMVHRDHEQKEKEKENDKDKDVDSKETDNCENECYDYDKFVENIRNGTIASIPQPLYVHVNQSWHCGNINFRLEIVRGYMKKRYLEDYPQYERFMNDVSGIILNYYNTFSDGEGYYANIKWLINHYTMKLGVHCKSRFNLILPNQSPLKWQTKHHCRIKWVGFGNNNNNSIRIEDINADNIDQVMVILKFGIRKKDHFKSQNFSLHFSLSIPCILYNIDYDSNNNNNNNNNQQQQQQQLNKKLFQVEKFIKAKKSKLSDSESMVYGFDFNQRPLTAKLGIGPGPNYDLVPLTQSKYYITQHKNKGKLSVKEGINSNNNNKRNNNNSNNNNRPIYLNVNDIIEMVIETSAPDVNFEIASSDVVYNPNIYDDDSNKEYNIFVSFYKNGSKKSILNQQFSILHDVGDVIKHCDIIPFFDWLNVRTNGYVDRDGEYLPDMYPDTWDNPQRVPFEFEIYGFET